MKEDGERSGVGCQDDDFRDTTVKSFRSFVGTFLQLAVVGRLLYNIEDLLSESGIGDGPSCMNVSIIRIAGKSICKQGTYRQSYLQPLRWGLRLRGKMVSCRRINMIAVGAVTP